MLCSERNAFWQEHQTAVKNYIVAIRELVVLVDHSATSQALNLAHLQIKAKHALCDAAEASLLLHEAEHGCQIRTDTLPIA